MTPEERADQRNDEILALESVYEKELEISYENDFPILNICISVEAKANPDINFCIDLQCFYDDLYPIGELNAKINYDEKCQLSASDKSNLDEILATEIAANVGSLVVYNIVSSLQERLQEIAERISTEDTAEETERKKAEEEEHRRKFIGTQVTVESFMEWRKRFDAEMEAARRARDIEDVSKCGKPTGKELFLKDRMLDVSDLALLADEPEMEIDEALFDIDDLDLDDLSD